MNEGLARNRQITSTLDSTMNKCPNCGEITSILSRDLFSGWCNACTEQKRKAEIEQRELEERQERERDRERQEALIVDGRRIACPICTESRFEKQESLVNARGTSVFGMDWTGALACTCIKCGHVLWFRQK